MAGINILSHLGANSGPSQHMMSAIVPLWSYPSCRKLYNNKLSRVHMCAGGLGTDTCQVIFLEFWSILWVLVHFSGFWSTFRVLVQFSGFDPFLWFWSNFWGLVHFSRIWSTFLVFLHFFGF